MNPRAYSVFTVLVAVLYFTSIASAQTPYSTSAPVASLDNSMVTIVPCTGLHKNQDQTVSLSPNGMVQVEGFNFDRYSVFDEQGEMWVAGPGSSKQIDLGYLPAGVYYLHLSAKDGEIVSKVLKGKK